MKRRDLLKLGAVAGGVLALGLPGRAAAQRPASKLIAVPNVDRLVVTTVVDNVYDVFAKQGKLGTINVERTALGAGGVPLLAEHGLAYHLASQRDDERREILLDFALTETALLVNYRALGVDPSRADALILSHGHLDHYGGLPALARTWQGKLKPGAVLYAGGADTFCQRVVATADGKRIDLGQLDQAMLTGLGLKTALVPQATVIAEHVFTSGQIPRLTAFERPPATARLVAGPVDSACAGFINLPVGSVKVAAPPGSLISDSFQGEHATAYSVRGRGLVVITSCAHAGIVNSVRQCQKVSGIDEVHAIVGGFHLGPASDEVVARTLEAFKQINPDYVIPAHCTGFNTIMALHREMPAKLVLPSAGTRIVFGA